MPSATIQPDLARNGSSLDAGSNDGFAIVWDMRLLRLEGLQIQRSMAACGSARHVASDGLITRSDGGRLAVRRALSRRGSASDWLPMHARGLEMHRVDRGIAPVATPDPIFFLELGYNERIVPEEMSSGVLRVFCGIPVKRHAVAMH